MSKATLPAPTFEPLDESGTKHALLLMKSMFCARPVMVNGKYCHLHRISAGLSGGHVEMEVGSPETRPRCKATKSLSRPCFPTE